VVEATEEEVVKEDKEDEVEKEDKHGMEAEMFTVEEEEEIQNGDVTIAIVINILNAIVKHTRKKEDNYGVVIVIQEDTQ
ncbi:MAG: hypothetical protein ACI8RD_007486, partial [Bacillariaceae sp.]|jgi:hypothetical protein